jgi:hypothetical protein
LTSSERVLGSERRKNPYPERLAETAVRDTRRKTRREFSEEEKIRVVLERLAG